MLPHRLLIFIIGLGLFGVIVFALGRDGVSTAKYKRIRTPAVIESVATGASQLMSRGLGAVAAPARTSSKTMIADATGRKYPGGEENRETEFSVALVFPRPPFVASVDGYSWGLPAGAYRLDVMLVSPASLGGSPTVAKGIDLAAVSDDRRRLESVFGNVLAAARLDREYEVERIMQNAVVAQSWMGDGIVAAATLLPPRPGEDATGSISIDLGADWRIESMYVDTTDTRNYYDVLRGE